MNLYFAEASPDLKDRQLLEAVLIQGKKFFSAPFHAPDLDIPPTGYFVVKVEWIEFAPIDQTLEKALPLPEYEPVTT